jgi:potassium efflux system protein
MGQTQTTVGSLLAVVVVVLGTLLLSRYVHRAIAGYFQRLASNDDMAVDNIAASMYGSVARIIVWFIGLEIVLHILGIHLSTLFAAGGFFALGAGFALKNVVENFISGGIIRAEKTIESGDLIIIDKQWLTIKHIGFRTIEAVTKDGVDIIIPSSIVAQSMVENLTRRSHIYRIKVNVGVAYDSDRKQVRKTLEDAVNKLDWVSKQQAPVIYLDEFGDSSINYDIDVWIDEVRDARHRRSDLHEAIWQALNEVGIVIAFPQLDVHLDRNESV